MSLSIALSRTLSELCTEIRGGVGGGEGCRGGGNNDIGSMLWIATEIG